MRTQMFKHNGAKMLRVIVMVDDVEDMKSEGFYSTEAEVKAKDEPVTIDVGQPVIAYVSDGDKGDGRPGSIEWHTLRLKNMTDKNDMEAYVKEAVSIDIDKRGGPDKVREKAIAAIEGALNDRDSE